MLPAPSVDVVSLFQSLFPNVDVNQLLVHASLLQQQAGAANLATIGSGTKHDGFCPNGYTSMHPPGYYAPAVISSSPQPEEVIEPVDEEIKEDEPYNFQMGRIPTNNYFPTHFMRGTVVKLSSGQEKTVDQLSSDDFLLSAGMTNDVSLEACAVLEITKANDLTKVTFMVASHDREIVMEVQNEHPFYILGKGWSSVDPSGTNKIYGLKTEWMKIGDICLALVMGDEKAKEHGPSVDLSNALLETERRMAQSDIRKELRAESGRRSAPPLGLRSEPRVRTWSDSVTCPIYSE